MASCDPYRRSRAIEILGIALPVPPVSIALRALSEPQPTHLFLHDKSVSTAIRHLSLR
jgi:hypothetical protein